MWRSLRPPAKRDAELLSSLSDEPASSGRRRVDLQSVRPRTCGKIPLAWNAGQRTPEFVQVAAAIRGPCDVRTAPRGPRSGGSVQLFCRIGDEYPIVDRTGSNVKRRLDHDDVDTVRTVTIPLTSCDEIGTTTYRSIADQCGETDFTRNDGVLPSITNAVSRTLGDHRGGPPHLPVNVDVAVEFDTLSRRTIDPDPTSRRPANHRVNAYFLGARHS